MRPPVAALVSDGPFTPVASLASIVETQALAEIAPHVRPEFAPHVRPEFATTAFKSPITIWSTVGEWVLGGVLLGLFVGILGGLFVRYNSQGVRRITDHALTDPIEAFVWGVGLFVAVVGGAILIGLLGAGVIAIPVLLVFFVFILVAEVFGFLAVGRYAVGESSRIDGGPRLVVLLAAAAALLAGAVPALGTAVGFVVGSIGIGAIYLDHRREYDREFETRLAGPPWLTSRVRIGAENGELTRFVVELTYWAAGEEHDLVQYVHDADRGDRDVTESGLYANVFGEAGAVEAERLTDPASADDAFEHSLTHLGENLETFVREFERRPDVGPELQENEFDEPLSDGELRDAAARLREQRTEVLPYVGYLLDEPGALAHPVGRQSSGG